MNGLLVLQTVLYTVLGIMVFSQIIGGIKNIRDKKAEGQDPLIVSFFIGVLFVAVVGFLFATGLVHLPFVVIGVPLNFLTTALTIVLFTIMMDVLTYLVIWAVYSVSTLKDRKSAKSELQEKLKGMM
ncbi:hypothetical protein [Bacillus phage SDFMU_Pbc]|uniref:Uncharacterized protein n=1 Tax=Bacillus phage SDFMU_Pbc TaxID=3076135 RepID=A0AA96KRN6_9CAUD|nr:hypothetical protein [Bacillus phage SDFMU_Pbc]